METFFSLSQFKFAIVITSAVILFLFGIESFSQEVQRVGGVSFQKLLSRWTKNRWCGALLGAFVTAVVQSSSAISVIAVALVNAGVLSFSQGLPILIGSNVGTTFTAQLVAWKLTGIGPFFIVFGFVLSLLKSRYSVLGKSIFYFGFVFFTLEIISNTVEPLKTNKDFLALLAQASAPSFGVILGALFTVMVQSSSVTTGVAVILVQQGIIDAYQGVMLVFGANIGTGVTALVASWSMDIFAKRAAIGNFIFKILAVLIALPFLPLFADDLAKTGGNSAGQVLANANLIFNVGAMVVALPFLKPFMRLIKSIVRTDQQEVVFAAKYLFENLQDAQPCVEDVRKEILNLISSQKEAFEQLRHCISENDHKSLVQVKKMAAYIGYIEREINRYCLELLMQQETEQQRQAISLLIQLSMLLKESADKLKDMVTCLERFYELRQPEASEYELFEKLLSKTQQILGGFEFIIQSQSLEGYTEAKNAENDLNSAINYYYQQIVSQRRLLLSNKSSETQLQALSQIEGFLFIMQSVREKMNSLRKYLKMSLTY